MILLLFFCSGATALVYEVVWSKYLSLIFGSTIYAQTIVLAVFMCGIALGNLLLGRRADTLKRPLLVYGLLEVLIGFYAFWFDSLYSISDQLFIRLGSILGQSQIGLSLLKLVLSIGLLLLPTVFMGGTLPLLSAWLNRGREDAGRWSARFYSVNTLGAVLGAWLSGFWMIRAFGMDSTLELTAMANLLIGFAAIGLSRTCQDFTLAPPLVRAGKTAQPIEPEANPGVRLLVVMVAITGGTSMGLEILASRSLSLLFGSSSQAFAVVLMAFILGIGLSSTVVASPRFRSFRESAAIGALLLGTAAILGALIMGIEYWVTVYRKLRIGLPPSVTGYRYYQILAGLFAMVLLGIPAALLGAVLPISIRLSSGSPLGARVGRLLTWNTLGAVVGVLFTGFILMPLAGLRNSFNLLALGLCLAAFWMAQKTRQKTTLKISSALLSLLLILSCAFGGEGWRFVLSAGAFRIHETEVSAAPLEMRKQHTRMLFYRDGPDATVSVEQGDGAVIPADLSLRINGKPDASTRLDMATQLLLAHLPMLARPDAKDVFVLGLATGITASGLLSYPVEHIAIAENCEPVLQAAELFAPWNRGVLTNRATRIYLEDARTVLKLSDTMYDVIISQPSNPWFATIGSVFSQEFFQIAARRLKPGGIMTQWFHVYEMDDSIVELILRTFASVFPVMEIWDAGGGDLILLGSNQAWDFSLAHLRRTYQLPRVQADLRSIGLATPEALLLHQLASQRTAFAIPGPGLLQSDGFPILEYDAPRAFFIGVTASRINRFDERTWQSDLASAEKRSALAGLDAESLRSAFQYETINPELWRAVTTRLAATGTNTSAARTLAAMSSEMPCLLVPGTALGAPPPAPGQASSLTPLYESFRNLMTVSVDVAQPGARFRDLLQSQPSTSLSDQDTRYSIRLALQAARRCLGHREYPLTRQLLALAAKLDPDDAELNYLKRILERENPEASPPPR